MHKLDEPIAFMSIDEASYVWEAAQDSLYLEIEKGKHETNADVSKESGPK